MGKLIKIELAGQEEGLVVSAEGNTLDNITWNVLWVRSDLAEVVEPDKRYPETCMVVFKGQKGPFWVKGTADEMAAKINECT